MHNNPILDLSKWLAWMGLPNELAAGGQAAPISPAHDVRATLYRDIDALESVWSRLESDGDCTVFQKLEVFRAWAREVGARRGADWVTLVLHDAGTGAPLMLLPLVIFRERSLAVIECADFGIADFTGPVVARGFVPTAAEMAEYWQVMRAALPPADLLRISKMPARFGRTRNPLLLLPNVNPMKLTSYKAALATDWGAWLETNVPEKLRADIARRRRKLGKRGAIRFHVAETEAEADTYFDMLLCQRRERFRALGRTDILDDAGCRAFYRRLVRPGDASSLAVLQALTVGDEIVATGYGLVHNEAFHMIFPGFAGQGWRNYSPGLQLFLASMEWSAHRGLKHYDFTIGDESFKRDLGAEVHPLYEKLTALSARGRRVVYVDRMRRFVRRNPLLASWVRRLRGRVGEGASS